MILEFLIYWNFVIFEHSTLLSKLVILCDFEKCWKFAPFLNIRVFFNIWHFYAISIFEYAISIFEYFIDICHCQPQVIFPTIPVFEYFIDIWHCQPQVIFPAISIFEYLSIPHSGHNFSDLAPPWVAACYIMEVDHGSRVDACNIIEVDHGSRVASCNIMEVDHGYRQKWIFRNSCQS